MRYAPLAVTRLVAAVCVCRPYAAKPIGASGCQGCAAPSAARPGLDAGASGDYRAWPSKDGKPQRPEAGQGSGSRAASTHETSLAMGSLPRRPDPQHTARPVKDHSYNHGAQRPARGGGARCPHAARQPTPAPRLAHAYAACSRHAPRLRLRSASPEARLVRSYDLCWRPARGGCPLVRSEAEP